jgi:hypothetical protein
MTTPTMGPLATRAAQWYQQYLPQIYDKITDKATYFGQLGDRAQQEIQQVADALAGTDPPDETFSQKLGRLKAAEQAATELVMRETLMSSPPPDWPDSDYPPVATPDPSMPPQKPTPEDNELASALSDFQLLMDQATQEQAASQKEAMPIVPPRPANLT